MNLEEAYKILGINNKNVCSDDLREYYQIRLKQVLFVRGYIYDKEGSL